MRVVILTSQRKGTASFFLPYLLNNKNIEIAKVIISNGIVKNKKNFYKKKFKKLMKIGILGALNGIRIRKWFTQNVNDSTGVQDIITICKDNNIPFVETDDINSDLSYNEIKNADAYLGLSLGNGYIKSKIFLLPQAGMINMHGEILPAFQNAQSVIWQIYNGSSNTGYTIHKIDKGIDSGDILKQELIPIIVKNKLSETVSLTCAEIQKRSAAGMMDVLNNFEYYRVNAIKQEKGKSYTTPSFTQFLKIWRNHKKLNKQLQI